MVRCCCFVPRWLIAAVLATVVPVDSRADVLDLDVVDEAGHRLPCRVLVRPEGGECVVPKVATELRIGRDRWFMSTGRSRIQVPAGRLLVRVERGLEHRRFKRHIEVAGRRSERVTLRRWIDMRRRGYLCGENHLHVDSVPLASMLVAEGLDFGTSLTWWNGPRRDVRVPAGRGRTRELRFAERTVPTTIHDAELEYAWGAAYLQNLPAPLPLKSERGRPNLDYLQRVVESGGMVHYQGGWSREVAVDALLGCVHTVNLCNNNFHLHRFQPRSKYSNLLEVEGFPVYPNTDVGMMRMNTDTYYRLLNWGLRLAAGAGSATGVKQVPPGYNRAYVRVRPDASIDAFNKAWAAGRNFVTNGPMLFLRTSDGNRPGDTIALGEDAAAQEGGFVEVEVEARSDQTLTSVEVIANGEVAKSFDVPQGKEYSGRVRLAIRRGSWIAARCMARDDLLSDEELAAYANGERQQPSRLRFAHTSPIYITVGGKRVAVRKSIEEGLRMLRNFEAFAWRTAGEMYRPQILAATGEARRRLAARLEDAEPEGPSAGRGGEGS